MSANHKARFYSITKSLHSISKVLFLPTNHKPSLFSMILLDSCETNIVQWDSAKHMLINKAHVLLAFQMD